jgi:hypothetical protein
MQEYKFQIWKVGCEKRRSKRVTSHLLNGTRWFLGIRNCPRLKHGYIYIYSSSSDPNEEYSSATFGSHPYSVFTIKKIGAEGSVTFRFLSKEGARGEHSATLGLLEYWDFFSAHTTAISCLLPFNEIKWFVLNTFLQYKKKVVGLERGPLSLVSTTEDLLGRNSSGSGLEIRLYGHRDSSRWPRGTFYPQKVGTSFAHKRRSLGGYGSLPDWGHGVYFFIKMWLRQFRTICIPKRCFYIQSISICGSPPPNYIQSNLGSLT